jgi:predicted transcriptional regulator of viral defense system
MKNTDFDTLYQIAEDQAGYFTAKQAAEAGYYRQRLYDLARRGQFIRVQHGIYRLTRFPASQFEDLFVARLRAGPSSVISHDSALAVYDLSDVLPSEIHVIIPRTGSRRRKGIRLHTHQLQADEITKREGLKVTTPERTVADMITSGLAYELVKQAVAEALQRGLTTKTRLLEQANRHSRRVAETIQTIFQEINT